MTTTNGLTEYVPSVRDIPGVKRAPVLAEASLSGKWIPPMSVYVAREVDAEIERLTRQRDSFEHQVDLKNEGLREQRAEIAQLREALADAVGAIEESIKANQRGIPTDWSGLLPSLKAALSGDVVQS